MGFQGMVHLWMLGYIIYLEHAATLVLVTLIEKKVVFFFYEHNNICTIWMILPAQS